MNANEKKMQAKIEALEAKLAKATAGTFYGALFPKIAKSGLEYESGEAIIGEPEVAYWVSMFDNDSDTEDAPVHNLKFRKMKPESAKKAFAKRDEYLASKS